MSWDAFGVVVTAFGVLVTVGPRLGERARLTRQLRELLELRAALPNATAHRRLRRALGYRAERLSERLTALEHRAITLRSDEWQHAAYRGVMLTLVGVELIVLGAGLAWVWPGGAVFMPLGLILTLVLLVLTPVLLVCCLIWPGLMLPAQLRYASMSDRIEFLMTPIRRRFRRVRGGRHRGRPQSKPQPQSRAPRQASTQVKAPPDFLRDHLGGLHPTFDSLRASKVSGAFLDVT
jgi:hypothetical protein